MDRQTHGQMLRWTDRLTNGEMDIQTSRLMDEQKNRQMEK